MQTKAQRDPLHTHDDAKTLKTASTERWLGYAAGGNVKMGGQCGGRLDSLLKS